MGFKVIDKATGNLKDFEPSESEVKTLAPKQRKAAKGVAGATEELEALIDQLIAEKQASNLYFAKVYLNRLLGSKSGEVKAADKDTVIPAFATALLRKDTEAAMTIARRLKRGAVAKAAGAMEANIAVSAAMAAKAAGKSVKRDIADEVAAAIAAINPAYAGYRPDKANRAAYEGYKKIKTAAVRDAALRDYLEDEEVAAKIVTALARRGEKEKEAVEAMRNVSPMERVAARMDLEAARRNVAKYIGEGKAYRDSNVRRLAEIRARGLGDLTALQYFKMIRDAFMVKPGKSTRRAKKPAGSNNSSNNGGAGAGNAAGGAGAGNAAGGAGAAASAAKPAAKSRGRSATRRANRAGAGAEALMAAMLGE